jgi:hypothetical protein
MTMPPLPRTRCWRLRSSPGSRTGSTSSASGRGQTCRAPMFGQPTDAGSRPS